ncbi:MAG TPA: PEP-CTERM sorting domain-containing protein [Rhodocyclaceae bacterium]
MKLRLLMAACALATAFSANAQNLVTNGDFSAGSAGWVLNGDLDFSSFPGFWQDGAFLSEDSISQSIGTVLGGNYRLSFDAAVSFGSMVAYWNGSEVATTGVTDGWMSYGANVVADSTQSILKFGTQNLLGFNYLDNVRLTYQPRVAAPVPEPETFAMMMAGLGVLGMVRRRRQDQA